MTGTSEPHRGSSPPPTSDATSASTPTPVVSASPGSPPRSTWLSRIGFWVQFLASLAVAGAVLAYLLGWIGPEPHRTAADAETPHPVAVAPVVEPVGPYRLRIAPDSSLARRIVSDVIEPRSTRLPTLRTTGAVVASLRPFGPDNTDQWQFNNPEVLVTFTEWRASQLDIAFAEEQIVRIEELREARREANRRIIERLERLVTAGTDSRADLEAARAEALEQDVEVLKDLQEAKIELRRAKQTEAVQVRQLEIEGFNLELLLEAGAEVDLVMADVPEQFQELVRVGQKVEARFFGLPRDVFPGVVRNIAPILSPERRSLRVLFLVEDPNDRLRPGMFADIRLGTEEREILWVPGEGVIHIGREDYVLVQDETDPDVWIVTPVEAGDTIEGQVEIRSGLAPNRRVVIEAAILLKPVAALTVDSKRTFPLRASGAAVEPSSPGTILESTERTSADGAR